MGKRERQREKKRKAQIQSRRSKAFPQRANKADAAAAAFRGGHNNRGRAGPAGAQARRGSNKQPGAASAPAGGAGDEQAGAQLYRGGQELLVLGDGDFSFSAGLAKRLGRGACDGLLATSFDAAEEVMHKYGKKAQSCIQQLHKHGAYVAHRVDATKLSATLPKGRRGPFDAAVFNFPHTGTQQVHLNRQLLRNFFSGVQRHLKRGGEVHVTIKTVPPYSRWDVPAQAEASGLQLARKVPFRFSDYPGYHHRTTEKDAMTFDAFDKRCVTFVFTAPGARTASAKAPRHGQGNGEDSDDDSGSDASDEGGGDADSGGDDSNSGADEEEEGDDEEGGFEDASGDGDAGGQAVADRKRKRGRLGKPAQETLAAKKSEAGKAPKPAAAKAEAAAPPGGGGSSASKLPRNKKLRMMLMRKERMDAMVRSEMDRFAGAGSPRQSHQGGKEEAAAGVPQGEAQRPQGQAAPKSAADDDDAADAARPGKKKHKKRNAREASFGKGMDARL